MGAEMTGAELIAAERQRQIDAEGWTPEHDERHGREELAWAATCYAAPDTIFRVWSPGPERMEFAEPWPTEWVLNRNRGEAGRQPWHRPECSRLDRLVKAGALIAAEIDRLRRASELRGEA